MRAIAGLDAHAETVAAATITVGGAECAGAEADGSATAAGADTGVAEVVAGAAVVFVIQEIGAVTAAIGLAIQADDSPTSAALAGSTQWAGVEAPPAMSSVTGQIDTAPATVGLAGRTRLGRRSIAGTDEADVRDVGTAGRQRDAVEAAERCVVSLAALCVTVAPCAEPGAGGATEPGGAAGLPTTTAAGADAGAGGAIADALADRILVAVAEATLGEGT